VGLHVWTFASLCQASRNKFHNFEGRQIVNIEFSTVQPLDPADLARAQPLNPGQPLRAEDVARALDGLFAAGRFEDIAVAKQHGPGIAVLGPLLFASAIDKLNRPE